MIDTPVSVQTDPELLVWVTWQAEHGTAFLGAVAELAKLADVEHYRVLRPTLLVYKAMHPVGD